MRNVKDNVKNAILFFILKVIYYLNFRTLSSSDLKMLDAMSVEELKNRLAD